MKNILEMELAVNDADEDGETIQWGRGSWQSRCRTKLMQVKRNHKA